MRGKLRAVARLLAIGGLAVLLTGCIKLHEDLTLNPDDTVSGSVVFAVDKQLLAMSGGSVDDFLNQANATDAPLPSGVQFDTKDYEDDKFVGKEYTFSDAPLSAFNDPSGELTITHEGDQFKVSGNLDMTSGTSGIDLNDPTTKQMLSSFDVQIAITFPGPVESATGTIDGNTVTWTPKFGENQTIEAVGSAIDSGGSSSSALLWILIGLAVVIVVIVAVVLLGRRGKGAPEGPTGFGAESVSPVAGPEGEMPLGEAVSGEVPAVPAQMPAAPVETASAPEETSVPEPPAPDTTPMPMTPATEPIEPTRATEPIEPTPPTEPAEVAPPEEPATEPNDAGPDDEGDATSS